jgi:hypothetical protein
MSSDQAPEKLRASNRAWLVLGLVGLGLVLAFGWCKSYENERSRVAQQAWRERVARIEAGIPREIEQIKAWTSSIRSAADARDQVARKFPDASWTKQGEREVAEWTSPASGLQLEFTFDRGHHVGNGARWGTGQVHKCNPPPLDTSRNSRAESIRKLSIRWLVRAWAALVFVSLASRRLRALACVGLLVLSAACGSAWLVDPLYDLSPGGIFSNDRLFWGACMIAQSVIMAALLLPCREWTGDRQRPIQFKLRTLLIVMVATGLLLAMGPYGYVALLTLIVAGGLFAVVRRIANRSPWATALREGVPVGALGRDFAARADAAEQAPAN